MAEKHYTWGEIKKNLNPYTWFVTVVRFEERYALKDDSLVVILEDSEKVKHWKLINLPGGGQMIQPVYHND